MRRNKTRAILVAGLVLCPVILLTSCTAPTPGALVKITKKRIPMDQRIAALCIGPPESSLSPHTLAEADVYANAQVISYRSKNPRKFSYPVGSTFVKKKYSGTRTGARQEKPDPIATIMVKKATTGKISDWDFHLLRLSNGKRITPPDRNSCVRCHQRYKSRNYISMESENALQEHLGLLE